MNAENIKQELQQVLDNDVALRKEFTELKRSLGDYRNQLIMREEDCKRLQVTIDVLNTKLVVMERDNTAYKAELTAFKELRGNIKDQLNAKQDEIDARLLEIESLKNDLNTIASSYEQQIENIKNDANTTLEQVKQDYTTQLNELRSNVHYKEVGLKDEYENRLHDLTAGWANKEDALLLNHQEEIISIKNTYLFKK
jgi:archaellum component FlaC